jgi:phage terminase large subunit GpA-like protein
LNLLIKITPILDQVKPRAEEKLSDWATKNFYLSSEYASYELYNYERRPYQKEVLDEIGDRRNERVTIVSATQMLKTLMLQIATANRIKNNPGAILHVMDTILNATKYSRQRLEPMIHDNQYLNQLIQEVKPKKADTVLMKKFVGGLLTLVGANSSSGLIFTSARDLMLDEVDSYPVTVGEFGDPVELAIRRTTEFEDRQIIMASSPGSEGASRIWPEFEATDQRYFYVPCPHCNEMQNLEFGGVDTDYGLKWKNGDPSTTYYLCSSCHKEIYNREKYWMLANGEWRKTFPERLFRPGFHINRLYSPSSTTSWDKIVEEWITARKFSKQGDHERLKVFINTVLAELWTPKFDLPKEEKLLQRVEEYYTPEKPHLPGGVCFLTAFVDVQDTWLHLIVKGWGIGEENWLIEEKQFQGNPEFKPVWNELDIYLMKAYQHPLGLNLHISVIGVDTGGHHSDQVYAFVKDRLIRKLSSGAVQKFYATKGWNTPWKPITDLKPRVNNKGGIPLYMVGTDTAKEVIFNRLAIENDEKSAPGYMHVNHFATADYFEGLISETIVRDKITKQAKWVKIPNRRNEQLDCEVGNLFVLRLSKANLLSIMEDLMKIADRAKQGTLFEQPKDQPEPRRGNWANSWNK